MEKNFRIQSSGGQPESDKKTTVSGQSAANGASDKHSSFNFRKLVNPVTAAIVLALIFILTGIHLPEILNTAFSKIGATATPLAMIYLGGVFACMDVKKYILKLDYYGIVAIKMLILYHPRIPSNLSRNPHDHDTHIRNAGHVLSGYDGKRIRHRRRLRYGRHPGDNCLFNRDAATGLLDFTIYIGAKKNERA